MLGEDTCEVRLEDMSDRDLMRLVVRGDQDAFDLIYVRYKPRLKKFIRNFITDEEAAEDLLQEVFLKVYQNSERYRPSYRFSGWIYRIATNICLNELRRRRTHKVISLNQEVKVAVTDSENEAVELHELIPDSYFLGPSEAVESSETREQILDALSSLSSVHRQVITMHLWEDMKYEQIAEILNCSVGTVKSRVFYGLKALRGKLESKEDKD